jgi:hypothetical protein
MNCKPGDLAVVVNSRFGNGGKLVRVLRPSNGNGLPIGTRYQDSRGTMWFMDSQAFAWEVEALGTKLRKSSGSDHRFCDAGDSFLRPIRPHGDDAQDESFRWAPAPEKATV